MITLLKTLFSVLMSSNILDCSYGRVCNAMGSRLKSHESPTESSKASSIALSCEAYSSKNWPYFFNCASPTSSAGDLAYWNYGLNELVTSSSASRTSSRVQLKQLELNHRWSHGHVQLRVDSIHRLLQQQITGDTLCLIGLTMVDLYEDESDLFVAGLAAGNQRVAVFSFARYDPSLSFSTEHWYDILPSKQLDPLKKKQIILQRSCKLLVHEIAHLFGVEHCIWYACCMNGSGHLAEDFAQPINLCPVDLHKLQQLCGFDIVDRYQKLLEFFKKHKMLEETRWFESRLAFINESEGR